MPEKIIFQTICDLYVIVIDAQNMYTPHADIQSIDACCGVLDVIPIEL